MRYPLLLLVFIASTCFGAEPYQGNRLTQEEVDALLWNTYRMAKAEQAQKDAAAAKAQGLAPAQHRANWLDRAITEIREKEAAVEAQKNLREKQQQDWHNHYMQRAAAAQKQKEVVEGERRVRLVAVSLACGLIAALIAYMFNSQGDPEKARRVAVLWGFVVFLVTLIGASTGTLGFGPSSGHEDFEARTKSSFNRH